MWRKWIHPSRFQLAEVERFLSRLLFFFYSFSFFVCFISQSLTSPVISNTFPTCALISLNVFPPVTWSPHSPAHLLPIIIISPSYILDLSLPDCLMYDPVLVFQPLFQIHSCLFLTAACSLSGYLPLACLVGHWLINKYLTLPWTLTKIHRLLTTLIPACQSTPTLQFQRYHFAKCTKTRI